MQLPSNQRYPLHGCIAIDTIAPSFPAPDVVSVSRLVVHTCRTLMTPGWKFMMGCGHYRNSSIYDMDDYCAETFGAWFQDQTDFIKRKYVFTQAFYLDTAIEIQLMVFLSYLHCELSLPTLDVILSTFVTHPGWQYAVSGRMLRWLAQTNAPFDWLQYLGWSNGTQQGH